MFFNFGMLELIIGILDLLFFILINLGFLGNINGNMNDDLKMFNGILLFFNMIEWELYFNFGEFCKIVIY